MYTRVISLNYKRGVREMKKKTFLIMTLALVAFMSVTALASSTRTTLDLTGVDFSGIFDQVVAVVTAVLPYVVSILGIMIGIKVMMRLFKGV